jgi:hypothetical protein
VYDYRFNRDIIFSALPRQRQVALVQAPRNPAVQVDTAQVTLLLRGGLQALCVPRYLTLEQLANTLTALVELQLLPLDIRVQDVDMCVTLLQRNCIYTWYCAVLAAAGHSTT